MAVPAAPIDLELEKQFAALKPEEAGDRIGNYKLIEQIGEGGFGLVWLAEQQFPMKRRVALKIIKIGMDTRDVIARFEQERQALAVMDHDNIARVYDAGTTQFGRPYFVMELVHGSRITDYCDDQRLEIRARLGLFIQVCQAVQHAHQKGIIHRDIKPSNILVALQDGVPVPKVIDFGVAKAIHGRLTDSTIATQVEQLIGTPLYMSPEQAGMGGVDIDTRSDIYSLGVLLYELLTGRTPFSRKEMTKAGYGEIRRMIIELEPKKPSTAVQGLDAKTGADTAAQRQIEHDKHVRLLRGDLDWITMKALEKDRARRYPTANGLSVDIHRYLADEPVSATPPSRGYRLRKFARRHKRTFSLAITATVALVIGFIAALYQRDRALRAEEHTKIEKDRAESSSMRANAEAQKREFADTKAKRISYLSDMKLANEALKANNIGLARQLLDRHRPNRGDPDLRDWEWRYLYEGCRSGALAELTHRPGFPVFAVSFSPNEKSVLAGYSDGRVELWDIEERGNPKVIQERIGQRAVCTFAPDGRSFVYVGKSGALMIAATGTSVERSLINFKGSIRDLSFSRDGQLLAVLLRDTSTNARDADRVIVVRVADGKVAHQIPMPPGGGTFFNNARISPDNQFLYVSCGAFQSPMVRRVRLADNNVDWNLPIGLIDDSDAESGSDTGFSAMDLSSDGRTLVLATGYRDPEIRVLDAERGILMKRLRGHGKYVLQLAFSGDGQILVSSSEDQSARLWDTRTWTKLAAPLRGHNSEVNGIAVSYSGRFVVTGSKDGELFLWDRSVPQVSRGPHSMPGDVLKVVPSPCRGLVFARSAGGDWSAINHFTLAKEPIPPLEIAEDGNPRLMQKNFRRTPQLPNRLELNFKDRIKAWAYSPDGNLLVVASETGNIGFFEVASEMGNPGSVDKYTLRKIDVLKSKLPSVFGVAFSPNGKRVIFTSGGKESVSIWDTLEREEVMLLSSNQSLLSEIAFTEDENAIIVGRKQSGSYLVWSAPSWQEIEEAERVGGLWPQSNAFPPRISDNHGMDLTEMAKEHYRARVAGESIDKTAPEAHQVDEAREELAEIYKREGRYDEAETLLRTLVDSMRPRYPRDDVAYLGAGKKLVGVMLTRLQLEQPRLSSEQAAKLSHQVDELLEEGIAISAQRSLVRPKDSLRALQLAVLQLWFRPAAEFSTTCGRLMRLAEETQDREAKEHAATAWALSSISDPSFREKAAKFAHEAMEAATDGAWHLAWCQRAVGLVAFRAGDFRAANEAFSQAEQTANRFESWQVLYRRYLQSSTRFGRAVVAYKQGNKTEADELLRSGEALMNPMPDDRRQAIVNATAFDDMMLWLIYDEARSLIRGRAQH